jgi:serine/threonine protein kinase/tetratricopeptide (TPR) repeat protein
MQEQVIFIEALEKEDPGERSAFLNRVCAGDPALRRRIERLLCRHEQTDSLLDSSPWGPTTVVAETPETLGPPALIGPYKLIEQIGEGGLGVVFLAEQTQPVRRRVALKVIKPGMDSREVIARFEAERQALALMDHPNIAHVLDGGETGSGRPYFVMELVKGVPITRYCDDNRLTPRQRLELFLSVCSAVQHAHQKGIIHRDLKPSNVLVTSDDGTPLVKVIDFGIAKALGQELTDKTLFTGFAQMLGTPLYMSPEQAALDGRDVDTRSDIYSLGVLLYELLTGTTPLEWDRLKKTPMLDVLRIIREEEPPRPSTRLRTAQGLPGVAAKRGLLPGKLSVLVQGELDWVVLKCLDKDRSRRYESANALARDVARYLHDEPVQACPPSAGYRLGKFARRHKVALTIASVLAVALLLTLAGVGGSVGWALRDKQARKAATEEAAGTELRESKRLASQARWPEARDAARRAQGLLARGQGSESRARQVRQQLADLVMVETVENICLGMRVRGNLTDQQQADRDYAKAFREYGIDVEALEPALAINLLKASAIRRELARALDNWALACRDIRKQHGLTWKRLLSLAAAIDPNQERRALRDAWKRGDLKALARLADSAAPALLQVPNVDLLADALFKTGAAERAVTLLKKAQQHQPGDFWINYLLCFYLGRQKSPQTDQELRFAQAAVALRSDNAMAHNLLGFVLQKWGALDEAIAEYQRAITLEPKYTQAHDNLGNAWYGKGKLGEAIASYKRALASNPRYAYAHHNLGIALYDKGKVDEAIACYHKAIELDPRLAQAHNNLGLALKAKGDGEGAIACYKKAILIDAKLAPAHSNLGIALKGKGKVEEAIACFQRAIALDPRDPEYHTSLGHAFVARGKVNEAIASYHRAIALNRKVAQAHGGLGQALMQRGQLIEAQTSLRRCLALLPARHPARGFALQLLRQCQQQLDAEGKLKAYLAGKEVPADAREQVRMAVVAQRPVKRLYLTAARLYREAFARQPQLAEAHRYNAACAAALAAGGKGQESGKLDDQERGRLRRQALDWLRADLKARSQQLGQATPEARPALLRALEHWPRDPDLEGVRDAYSLARLPAEERAAWHQLWSDVRQQLECPQRPR